MKCEQTPIVDALDVLVVDADPGVGEMVKEGAAGWHGKVRIATSVDQAQSEMKRKAADVLLVSVQINDNAGIRLIKALREKYPRTETIALSRGRRGDTCLDAWRAGAVDMLVAPLHVTDIQRSLAGVLSRRTQVDKLTKRNRRLRNVCRQLNKARHEISQQVDLLCNDLVRAYQEMAQQLNSTQMMVDYTQAAGNEIEVEGLLRKTMEWVLGKLGPINAAVYLSDADRRFSLGAYLNLDTEADAAMVNAVGETIVKQCENSSRAIAVEDDRMIDEMFGEQGAKLKGRTWLSAGCFGPSPKRECLAVLVVFRRQSEALDPAVRQMVEAIAPVLGEKIEQALELYHRMHPEGEEDMENGAQE